MRGIRYWRHEAVEWLKLDFVVNALFLPGWRSLVLDKTALRGGRELAHRRRLLPVASGQRPCRWRQVSGPAGGVWSAALPVASGQRPCRWRQVSGPAGGVRSAALPVASGQRPCRWRLVSGPAGGVRSAALPVASGQRPCRWRQVSGPAGGVWSAAHSQ